MADIQERPSKIRKIGSPRGPNEVSQGGLQSMDLLEELPKVESARFHAGEEGNNSKVSQEYPPISKSQLKKLRKAEQWEANKDSRKAFRREKHKEKQARKAKDREELKEKILKGEAEKPVIKRPTFRRPIQVPLAILLDCDFNDLMTDKELISLGAQLTRCYSENRCNPYRTHFAISSWGGKLQTRFETVLTNNHQSWKGVKFFGEDFEVAAKELDGIMRSPEKGKLVGALALKNSDDTGINTIVCETARGKTPEALFVENIAASDGAEAVQTGEPQTISAVAGLEDETSAKPEVTIITTDLSPEPSLVYLTSDSPNTLKVLSPNTTYIVGGIVDKNRHKGLCYKRACERGIPTARLPIGEYMTMQSRSVLTINHVVEIMLKWLDTGDWGEAFLQVIPKRKEAKLKVGKAEESNADEGSNDGASVHSICDSGHACEEGDKSSNAN